MDYVETSIYTTFIFWGIHIEGLVKVKMKDDGIANACLNREQEYADGFATIDEPI